MTNERSESLAVPAPSLSAPVRLRAGGKGAVSFVGMAALGATFVGFLSYWREPDVLATSFAAGATFIAIWVALYAPAHRPAFDGDNREGRGARCWVVVAWLRARLAVGGIVCRLLGQAIEQGRGGGGPAIN